MKVLHVTHYETPGRRFNGIDVADLLACHDITSKHIVWSKDSEAERVTEFPSAATAWKARYLDRLHRQSSLQALLPNTGRELLEHPDFIDADLVHLHLIHTGYLSLLDLPALSDAKPLVWTLHDPWALTGHCLYPQDCDRWKIGCGDCPDLRRPMAIEKDTTALHVRLKRSIYRRSSFDVIVASRWMEAMVSASPLFGGRSVHVVPFGVDTGFFSPVHREAARARLGFASDEIVLFFRAQKNGFKGTEYILEALRYFDLPDKLHIVTVDDRMPQLVGLAGRSPVTEYGWTQDQDFLRDIMAASDLFLMPSVAEAFGVMAIEAMACGLPIICFEGTALPDITAAPEIGVAVPMRNVKALADAISHLLRSPSERQARGAAGRDLVERTFDRVRHADRMAELYRSVIASRSTPRRDSRGSTGGMAY